MSTYSWCIVNSGLEEEAGGPQQSRPRASGRSENLNVRVSGKCTVAGGIGNSSCTGLCTG